MFSSTVSDNSDRVSGIIMGADFWGAIGANAFAPKKKFDGHIILRKNTLANLPTAVL